MGSGNGLMPSGNKQAITWANVDPDLCHHMASLGHNESTQCGITISWFNITLYCTQHWQKQHIDHWLRAHKRHPHVYCESFGENWLCYNGPWLCWMLSTWPVTNPIYFHTTLSSCNTIFSLTIQNDQMGRFCWIHFSPITYLSKVCTGQCRTTAPQYVQRFC